MLSSIQNIARRRDARLATSICTVLGASVAALTLGLAAQPAAADDGANPPPWPPERTHSPITLPPDVTVVPPAPPLTLPPDVTVVPPAPPLTLPGGIPTVPDGATTDPGTATTDPGTATDATTPPPGSGSGGTVDADGDGAPDPWDPEAVSVDIALAQVECDGTIHVEFATVASPDPGWPADHVVMFNPVDNPAELHAFESSGNPANGAFTFEQPGTATGTYRVLVVGLFDPEITEGVKAIDEAETVPAPAC
jgi:hypothetical protein